MVLNPAKNQDIAYLTSMGYPLSAISYFQRLEPSEPEDVNGVRMYPIKDIRVENEEANPGCIASPRGYLNIANTLLGDTYCLDINSKGHLGEPPVVLVSHDLVKEDVPHDEMPDSIIKVAESFDDFILLFKTGQLPADFWELKDSL